MRVISKAFAFWFFVPFGILPAHAATLLVPSEFTTVQAAIDCATHGDEVVVSPGTYIETIHFGGKNIHLRSTDPQNWSVVEVTILDGDRMGAVVILSGSETFPCSISGLTITGGGRLNKGGGIRGNGAFVRVENNRIVGNSGYDNVGGGVTGVSGPILSNRIMNNTAHWGGGLADCNGLIFDNEIMSNTAESSPVIHAVLPGNGGGLDRCNGEIRNNNISFNFSDGSGAGLAKCDGLIVGNTIYANQTVAVSYDDFALGGGLYLCAGEITENLISENRAESGAGLSHCNGTIQNNLILHNDFQGYCVTIITGPFGGSTTICPDIEGSGLRDCNGVIRNNTLFGNSTRRGAVISDCEGILENCIVWAKSATETIRITNSNPVYCCIQNWTQGGWGNISENPLFVDAENGDFNLKAISPCIDAGRNVPDLLTDYDGDARPYNGTEEQRGDGSDYDMGAQEYRLFLHPGADIVKDLRIDPLDLLVMQRDWYRVTDVEATRKEIPLVIDPDTDIDLSGRTDRLDLFILLNDWGRASDSSKVFGSFESSPTPDWD